MSDQNLNEPKLLRNSDHAKVHDQNMCLLCSQDNCIIDMGGVEIACTNLVDDEEKEVR